MPTSLVRPFDPSSLTISSRFRSVASTTNDDLSQGVSGGFPVLSYRGKVFRLRWRGETMIWRDPETQSSGVFTGAIVRASPNLSKVYYRNTYSQGSDAAPDCWSNDGVRPDPSVAIPVSTSCASCPMNVFGSRKRPDDATQSKAKACGDFRRLALAPVNDIACTETGSPILLRVPPASLRNLANFATALKRVGVPYYAVLVQIAFTEAEFPQFEFRVARALDDREAEAIIALRDDDTTMRVLAMPESDLSLGSSGRAVTDGETEPASWDEEEPAKAPQPTAANAEEDPFAAIDEELDALAETLKQRG